MLRFLATFILSIGPLALGHTTRIEHVTIMEMARDRYGIRYVAPPPGMSEFAAPTLPSHCKWADPEDFPITETSTSLVFETDGRPLTAEDQIILPWQRNGVMVVMKWRDGSIGRQFFPSGAQGIVVEMSQLKAGSGPWQATARRFVKLGFEHILGGFDHLLFVVGLLLMVRDKGKLLATITAFTVAHSITLGLSVLGWFELPSEPVESIIALSILCLAVENVDLRRGRSGLTSRHPWVVSFVFGLIHGLGFAGALGELGLSQVEIPSALLFFNLGVEAGQILFVAGWFVLMGLVAGMKLKWPVRLRLAPEYALGILAGYWLLDRTIAMLPI